MNKKYMMGVIFCSLFLLLFTIICYVIRINGTDELSVFFRGLTSGNQIKSILVACSFFLYGQLVSYVLYPNDFEDSIPIMRWIVSYPIGFITWSLCSVIVLLFQVKYTLFLMVFILLLLLGGLVYRKKASIKIYPQYLGISFWGFLGVASFASSGVILSYITGDSCKHILQLGHIIAKEGYLLKDQAVLLHNYSIVITVISSLIYFVGGENIYTLQQCFMICFWLFFGYTLYKSLKINDIKKKRWSAAAITLIIYFLLPPINFLSGLVLTHTYQMACVYVLVWLLGTYKERTQIDLPIRIGIVFLSVFIVLLRSDSPITLCVVLFCMITCKFKPWRFMARLLAYCMGVLVLYYCGINRIAPYENGNMVSWTSIALMLGLFVLLMIYNWVVGVYGEKGILKRMEIIAYGGLILFNFGLCIAMTNTYIDNFKTIFINATDYTQLWGATFWLFLVLLFYSVYRKEKNDAILMAVIFCIIVSADLGVLRSITGYTGAARYGWGDSMNRAFWSFLPMAVGMGAVRLCNHIDWGNCGVKVASGDEKNS